MKLAKLNVIKTYRVPVLALIFTVSLITSSEYFHYHTGSDSEESHCPICIIIYSFSKADVNYDLEIVSPTTFELLSFIDKHITPELKLTLALSDRAPPFNS